MECLRSTGPAGISEPGGPCLGPGYVNRGAACLAGATRPSVAPAAIRNAKNRELPPRWGHSRQAAINFTG